MKRREFITLLGAAVAGCPLAARAQQRAKPLIGFLSGRSPDDSDYLLAAFRRGLAEDGFVEGQNVAVEYRWARGDYSRLPELAADLVKRPLDVLVGVGGDQSARGKGSYFDHSGRFWNGWRSCGCWHGRKPQPARRKRNGGDCSSQSDHVEAAWPASRTVARIGRPWCSAEPERRWNSISGP